MCAEKPTPSTGSTARTGAVQRAAPPSGVACDACSKMSDEFNLQIYWEQHIKGHLKHSPRRKRKAESQLARIAEGKKAEGVKRGRPKAKK